MSSPTAPMLATLGSAADVHGDEGDWAFEMKWDGIRAIARVENSGSGESRISLTSRNGRDTTAAYPELVPALRSVVPAGSATLDGEIVALNGSNRPDFGLLQQRINLTGAAEIRRLSESVPVHYLVFDILERDGTSLVRRGYDERRRILDETVHASDHDRVQVPPAFPGGLEEAVARSLELGLEGVVAKERDSTYAVGARSRAWIKIKHHRTQEVVVGGWRPGNGRRAGTIGSLLVGIPDGDRVRYVGRVGTGFRDRDLAEISRRLEPRARVRPTLAEVPTADARDAHWVVPDLVGEVEFAEWTSGGHLRQPSWRGWRPDKSPGEVRPE